MTDTEILDWIEEQAKHSYSGVGFDYGANREDREPREFRFMRHHFLGPFGKGIREAVKLAKEKL